MKNLKKTLILLCSVLVLVFSAAIAACGSGNNTLSFQTFGGTEIPPIEAAAGADISGLLPEEPVRDGYFFEGWYLEEDCSGVSQELPSVMPEKSATYYAKWVEGTGAKLTLSSGNGGVLERTQYNVKIGANLLEFLADKQPTPQAGLTFAGWYRGSNPVSASDVMPAAGVSLTAKYNASYTVEVYRQQADGTFVKDGENLTGAALYGEPFSCASLVEIDDAEHFYVDAGDDGRIQTDSLGVGQTFKLYVMRRAYYVYYDANEPSGVAVSGVTPMTSAVYGGKFTLGGCGYVLSGNYRFLGWAYEEEVSSPAELLPAGTQLDAAMITLHAIWERGYADVFGGADVIYPDTFEEGVLHLEREGLELKEGTLEGDYFRFEDETGELRLSGRFLPDENGEKSYMFFYYRDDLTGKVYTDMDNTSATLEMKADGVVEYRDAAGELHTGRYSVNSDGYFVFDAGEGQGEDFLYNLYTYTDGDERVVFRRQSEAELGYYFDQNANIVLYLDGLGGLKYYYHQNNAEYTDFTGAPVYVAIGYYEKRDDGLMLAYTRDIVDILKQFTFSIAEGGLARPADFPALPSDATIKGSATMDDGLRGEYTDKWEQTDKALYLDGYGNGTYGGEAGTYYLATWLYSYEEDGGDVIDDYLLVCFTPSAGGSITYFRMDPAYGDFELDREIDAAEAAAYTGAKGRFDLTNDLFVLNITFFNGFVYIFENGNAEVWTEFGRTTRNNIVYYLEPALVSTVEKNADTGEYTFKKTTNEATGETYLNEFTFTVDETHRTATVTLPDVHETVQVATVGGKALVLDYTARTASFGGDDIDYWYTIGYIDLYTFDLGEELLYYWTAPGQHSGFTAIGEHQLYTVQLPPDAAEDSYIAQLCFTGTDKVYLAYQLESGLFRVVGEGTVETAESGDYVFTFSKGLADMEDREFDEYRTFTFRTYNTDGAFVGTFVKKNSQYSFKNFKPDGYGRYTYTDSLGDTYDGTILSVIGSGDGMLIFFECLDSHSAVQLFTFAVNSALQEVVAVSEDAGYWYEMNDNQYISEYKYLLFDGRGNAFYYEYDWALQTTEVTRGTYRRSPAYRGSETANPFFEYIVTMYGDETNYLVGMYVVQDGTETRELPLYQAQIPHRVGNFRVRGGGTIESVGYPGKLAVYTDAFGMRHEGNMYIGNVDGEYDSHGFTNTVNGKQVRFWEFVNGISTDTEYIFDIVNGILVPHTLPYGEYAFYMNNVLTEDEMLRLDGRGGAVLVRGKQEIAGEYEALTTGDYRFTASELEIRFRLSAVTIDDEQYYVYERYSEDGAFLLLNEEDWSALVLDGYGGAHYINRYGDRIVGTYALFDAAHGVGAFEADTFGDVFDITEGGYSFRGYARYAASYYAEDFSSVVFTATRAIINGAESFYSVGGSSVTLYATGNYAQGSASVPGADTYTYNGKEYRKYAGGELTFTDSSYKTPVSLKFTPDGATFTVPATFGGFTAGYNVIVGYAGGAVSASLTYYAGTMDARVETYPLTLRYTGGENTFSATPQGRGTFHRVESSAGGFGGTQTFEKDVIVISGGRIGAYIIELPAQKGLQVTLDSFRDTLDEPLHFEGELSDLRTESDTDFRYGAVRALNVTGTDGKVYTVRLFLNEADSEFILRSILLEKTFTVEGAGEVTIAQLWAGGTRYTGDQKDVVEVFMEETATETSIFTGSLGANTAAIVRQALNTSTGSLMFRAHVFTLTFDGEGFVTDAQKTGDYRYGEALEGVRYKVRFLYTGTGADFEVQYLLTFSEGDRSVDATFEKTAEKNVWTIGAGLTTYRAAIAQNASGFALTLQRQ